MNHRIASTIVLLVFCIKTTYSQDTIVPRKVKILPVPAFGYSPETKAYIGAVTLFTLNFYNDTLTRTSNAKFEFNYTWNKQIILENEWNYFFKKEQWFTKGKIHFSRFPDQYWGIGSEMPDSNKLTYNSARFITDIFVLKSIAHKIFTGINLRLLNYADVTYEKTNINFQELAGSNTYGIGYSFIKDTRNSLLTPLGGMYLSLNTSYNFSTGNYLKNILDIRYYKTWSKKYTLASRFVNESNFGNPSFYDLAFLGGDKFVRGYYYGRYRDKNLMTIQAEARLLLIKRFGLAIFGGTSNIFPDYSKIVLGNTKPNCGIGIRYVVDRKEMTNLRIDYALGEGGNSGFYISFGESF